MGDVIVHFMDVNGHLHGLKDRLASSIESTYKKASDVIPLDSIDIAVRATDYVIPESGDFGVCYPGFITLAIDLQHAAYKHHLEHSIAKLVAHELNHASRFNHPGLGFHLGEQLVSEGLACMFARELCHSEPEPWEQLTAKTVAPFITPALKAWNAPHYNHAEWFLGAGNIPRWTGYTLGSMIVLNYLKEHKGTSAASLTNADAQLFLPTLEAMAQ